MKYSSFFIHPEKREKYINIQLRHFQTTIKQNKQHNKIIHKILRYKNHDKKKEKKNINHKRKTSLAVHSHSYFDYSFSGFFSQYCSNEKKND